MNTRDFIEQVFTLRCRVGTSGLRQAGDTLGDPRRKAPDASSSAVWSIPSAFHRRVLATVLLATSVVMSFLASVPQEASAAVRLQSICRVEGQEDVTLQGLGIVTGLQGTGDGAGSVPTIRALATAMELLGNPVGTNPLTELKDAKNVALVIVTARVPAAGARQGDRIDCHVSAISAKSLAGGRLFLTPLTGPVPSASPPVFALAEGPITIDDPDQPTTGTIHGGCRFLEDFTNPFASNGQVTLVVRANYAGFQVTQEIADLINTHLGFQTGGKPIARAIDQVNVEVNIPTAYENDVVSFIAQIMAIEMIEPQLGPRVVVRERSGSIVIGGDVEIGPVVVSHKNLVVETGLGDRGAKFVGVDSSDQNNAKLKALVEALNSLHVPAEEMIDIIKAIDRQGKLYGQLIVE